jgi:hypothetical protein
MIPSAAPSTSNYARDTINVDGIPYTAPLIKDSLINFNQTIEVANQVLGAQSLHFQFVVGRRPTKPCGDDASGRVVDRKQTTTPSGSARTGGGIRLQRGQRDHGDRLLREWKHWHDQRRDLDHARTVWGSVKL